MNDEQYKRYRKMKEEPIKCLFSVKDKAGRFHFLVSGSTGTHYKVTISSAGGKISCSCPDFRNNSKNYECVCKHCLFIILEKMRLFDIYHTFFKRPGCHFTPDEIALVAGAYKLNTGFKNKPF